MIVFLAFGLFIAVDLWIGFTFGMRTLVVICFLLMAWEILWDWYKKGWDYVSNCRFNYVFKALSGVIAIVLLLWLSLLPRHSMLWLAVPIIIPISIPVALTLAHRICEWIPARVRISRP